MASGSTDDSQGTPDLDWKELRTLSLRPGGFGDERISIWAKLLAHGNTTEGLNDSNNDSEKTPTHRDERQIRLDTDRSFVLYPVDDDETRMKEREARQEELRQLIVSVFHQRPKLSYFQGYHDIITVLFLTLPPELRLMCAENMSLQRLRDSMGAGLEPLVGLLRVLQSLLEVTDPAFAAILQEASPLPYFALSNLLTLFSHDMPTLELIQHVFDYILCRPPIIIVYLAATFALSRKAEVERLQQAGEEGMIHSVLSGLPDLTDSVQEVIKEEEEKPLPPRNDETEPELPNLTTSSSPPTVSLSEKQEYPVTPPSENRSADSVEPIIPNDSKDEDEKEGIYSRPTTPLPRKPTFPLSELLIQSDELFALYPPTHPSLQLASVMGPQSVVYTWSENYSDMPDPDEAEAMVDHPELVIRPFPKQEDSEEKPRGRRRQHKNWRLISRGPNAMLASTVIVLSLSIILAMYGPKDSGRDLTRAGRWASRILLGLGDRWWAAFERN